VETILVVDDEDDIRTAVRKMLEAKGYTVLDPQALHPRCTRSEGPPAVAGAALAVRSPDSPAVLRYLHGGI
jgi:CheY-like chemotaxis protein